MSSSQPQAPPKEDDELYRRFRAPLMSYFLKRVNLKSDAEDLTQEVFARLVNHPDRRQGQTIDSYVFTIAVNLLRDRARSSNVSRRSGFVEARNRDTNTDAASGPVEELTPERVLLGREALKDVMSAFGELSERTRDIFVLSRLENMHHRDIASLYGISVSAVEKHVMRAAAHLGARFLRR